MKAIGRLARRIWYFLNRRRVEQDLEREMALHRAQMSEPQRFGKAIRLREQSADVWGWTWIDALRADLRYAARLLYRAPAFAAAAIATLALGIGASTAIFSVAYGVSLRPLPYHDPDRLVRIYEANRAEGRLTQNVSEATFPDWRAGASSFEAMALYSDENSRPLANSTQRVTMMGVSPVFFQLLGTTPILGRGFKTDKEYGRTADEVMLSYAAWQRLFGGRRDVVGSVIAMDDDDMFVVVGVMPREFDYGPRVDMWRAGFLRPVPAAIVRGWRYDHVVARLRPGATIDQARAELNAVAARLAREYPATNAGWTVTVEPLHTTVIGDFGRATWLLLAAVAVVLLVACVNVAGLLLARAAARERETAVREALGAGRSRLVRQWLAESVLLAALGTGFGVMLAWLGVLALKAAAPPGIPRLDAIALDRPVLLTALLSCVIATLTIGAAPLRGHARMPPVTRRLQGGGLAGDSVSRRTARDVLVLAQCAGAVALLVLAMMLTRSFGRLSAFDLGWNAERIVSLKPSPPMPRTGARNYWLVDWSDRVIARLEATPGIVRAAITTSVPMSPQFFPITIARGARNTDDARWSGVVHHVTHAYFDVMDISLVAGRTFAASDRFSEARLTSAGIMIVNSIRAGPSAGHVAVISQSVARTLWPGRSALGQIIRLPDFGTNAPPLEVVGVVEDLQFHAVGEQPTLHVFVPWTQENSANPFLLAKGSGDAASTLAAVRRVVEAVEPTTGIEHTTALETLVSRATAQPRFTARTVAAFGLLALVLAAIGIYGTLSYVVGARTRDIAVRLSLGASRSAVLPGLLRGSLLPVLGGGLIGVAIAAGLARTFEALLFQIEPLDAASFAGGAILLLAAVLAAALAPARRVLKVDPAAALRSE
jgi:putative ABC transport system permease protein